MPTVPITGQRQLLTGQAPSPSPTEIAMALAEMNSMGRLAGPTVDQSSRTNKKTPSPLK